MKQEYKDLLIKDLSSRLPYGVILECADLVGEELRTMTKEGLINNDYDIDEVKPMLFPLSSMTEEQEKELITITDGKFRYRWGDITNAIPRKNINEWGTSENAFIKSIKVINSLYIWLLKNHFDIYGLIPLGLAKDVTGLGIYGK